MGRISFSPALYHESDVWDTAGPNPVSDFLSYYRYEALPHLFDLSWETHAGAFSTLLTLPIRKSVVAAAEPEGFILTNITPDKLMDVDMTFPFRASISYENGPFSAGLARGPLKIGEGYWSSMVVNGQAPFFDYLQGSFDTGFFRVRETLISLNPYLVNNEERNRQDKMPYFHTWEPEAYRERVKTAAIHELNWKLNRINIGLGELMLIGGRSIQIKDFNPFLVYHNAYGEDWGNVIAFFNFSYEYEKRFRLYADFSADDITAPVETKAKDAPPPAIGALLEIQSVVGLASGAEAGIVLEGAYVSPTFGMRGKPLQTPYARTMYLDNTVGGRRLWVDYPLGYYLGNDLIDARLLLSYSDRFMRAELGYHMLMKGEETLHGDLALEGTGYHTGFLPRGTVEYVHEISGGVRADVFKGLEAGLGGSLRYSFNAEHKSGRMRPDSSFTVYVKKTFTF